MPSYTRFFVGFLLGLMMAGLFYFFVIFNITGVPVSWTQSTNSLIRKAFSDSELISEKKIVISGGSSTGSINYDELSQSIGIPAMGTGCNAGLGLEYILYSTGKLLKSGDIVILAPEYELYESSFSDYSSPTLVSYAFGHDPEYLKNISVPAYLRMSIAMSWERIALGMKEKRKPSQMTPPDTIVINRKFKDRPIDSASRDQTAQVLVTGIDRQANGFALLRCFIKKMQSRGVIVMATFPCIRVKDEYGTDSARESFKTIQEFYLSQGVPVLGVPQEYMYEEIDFYDTNYHLTNEASKLHTEKITRRLKEILRINGNIL